MPNPWLDSDPKGDNQRRRPPKSMFFRVTFGFVLPVFVGIILLILIPLRLMKYNALKEEEESLNSRIRELESEISQLEEELSSGAEEEEPEETEPEEESSTEESSSEESPSEESPSEESGESKSE